MQSSAAAGGAGGGAARAGVEERGKPLLPLFRGADDDPGYASGSPSSAAATACRMPSL